LSIIDENWKDHLRKMDELKQTVQNATYEQKDPLLVYKFEAFELFQATVDVINKEVLSFLFKGHLPSQDVDQVSEAPEHQATEQLDTRKDEVQNSSQQAISNARNQQTQEQQVVETIVREEPKVGRNEKVTIKNVMSGEEKELKYKQAIPLLESGKWVVYQK
ncbi:preprotein translocase subunit SecA, partial [Tenacibaculum finnmarkense genomovar ulcerans]|nr:preprotein translocase subunit SecA [Tenacibaculum finnmarkense genomovar ulcerans]